MQPQEQRDVYWIPQNFIDTHTIFGGQIKLRNAIEAAILAIGAGAPVCFLPLALNYRIMLLIVVSVPLGILGVVGIGGDSLSQFAWHWLRFWRRRRILTPTAQEN